MRPLARGVLIAEFNDASVGDPKPIEHIGKECRFTRAVGSDDAKYFIFTNFEIDILQGLQTPKKPY
jgi:hypothetical protein